MKNLIEPKPRSSVFMDIRINIYGLMATILIIVFTFQNPLENVWSGFAYIDEVAAATSAFLMIRHYKRVKTLLKNRKVFIMVMCFFIFIFSGLTANIVYKFQPMKAVAIDLFTNMKFYLALITGYLLFSAISWNTLKKYANKTAKLSTVFLVLVFIADRLFNFYGGDIRYGIRSTVLFFYHPTYLAGSLVFLLALLTVTYKQDNKIYIALNVFMLFSTLRSKAIAGAAVYILLLWYILIHKRKLKPWQITIMVIIAIFLAWEQIYFYYIKLAGEAARSIMTITSFKIAGDFFPIGTGFATFASHEAANNYSPVYLLYGFAEMWDVSYKNPGAFLDDTFWPIIIGQTGFIGTISYLSVFFLLFRQCFRLKKNNLYFYMSAIFMFTYLLISSMAEPAFNNSIAIPLGFLLGNILCAADKQNNF